MKIADDFDAIRQRVREIEQERPAAVQPPAVQEPTGYEADVSDHYHLGGAYMIVA